MKIDNLVRENILKLTPYSSAKDEFTGSNAVFLDANENPFGTYNRYPDPLQRELKARISKIKNIPVENIFIGNGSDEIIDLIFRVFCEPKQDKLLTFSPTYGMYEVSANINNIEIIEIPLDENFQINYQNIEPYLDDKTIKLIYICSPNNPTGNLLDKETIIKIVQNFRGIVVIDEAYIDFADEPSLIYEIKKYPNLVVQQTFSKGWGMAGLRVGMAFASKEIIHYLNKVKPPYNVSKLSQEKVLEKLNNVSNFETEIKLIKKERDKLIAFLNKLSIVTKVYPTDTNYILVETIDADNIYNSLKNNNLIVRNRSKIIHNCLRISIGSPEENQLLKEELLKIGN